jgi:voltage-gated potassium channel
VLSILVVIAESIQGWSAVIGPYLRFSEYVFTFFFTVEYLLRLYCSPRPRKYALSFFGIIDLLATLPLYIGWFFGTARYLLVIRTFRLIRVFRIFKLFNFLDEGNLLLHSLTYSSRKIIVFFLFVLILVISIGTLMYMVEGGKPNTQFSNIPNSIYWACVTLTTNIKKTAIFLLLSRSAVSSICPSIQKLNNLKTRNIRIRRKARTISR